MNRFWVFSYYVTLSLWIGGISIFTFIVTPVIFRSFGRDMAGRIVGSMFSGYFTYNLALSLVALLLLLITGSLLSRAGFRISLILVVCAIVINLYVAFRLHPEIKRVKQEVHSFETQADDSPARKEFRNLHAVSASLNLLLLADGIALLFISSVLKKQM